MEIKRIVSLYFSPTDATKKITRAAAAGFGKLESLELDRTAFSSRWTGARLEPGDAAVIGMPVYYGRAPKILVEFFRYIEARDIPAVVVSVYGNRDYEDALLELTDECRTRGFLPVAAGAFIGQHSFSKKLGTGRPDAADIAAATDLGRQTAKLLAKTENPRTLMLKVKGSNPYTPGAELPIVPETDMNQCTGCMICQKNCPVQAINPLNPAEIDAWRCLDCARCIHACPTGAKTLAHPALKEKIAVMEAMFTAPRQPELFFAAPEVR